MANCDEVRIFSFLSGAPPGLAVACTWFSGSWGACLQKSASVGLSLNGCQHDGVELVVMDLLDRIGEMIRDA